MRHKWKALCLLLIMVVLVAANVLIKLFAVHPFATHEQGDFKVLCLNVHSTGECFEERSLRIDSLVKAEDPDFVFLTEYHDTCSLVLDSLLRERYEYCQRGIRGNYNLTECVYSKCRIDSICDIHIDTNAPVAQEYLQKNPSLGYHIYHSAIMRYEVNVGNQTVVINTCHLNSNNYLTEVDSSQYTLPSYLKGVELRFLAYRNGSLLRELEAEAICDYISKTDAPTIVLGDMNDISFSSCLDLLDVNGLKDAWWQGGFGLGNTFVSESLRLRIDHIMYNSKLMLTDVKVVDDDVSDHRPLVAGFRLKDRK